jgi:ATP-binding cassette subfamily B protein
VSASTEPLSPLETGIELDNISLAYSADRHFSLRNVSLQIPKGARVGFVGKTGSGKTTLLNLVMGLLEPGSGRIRVDGCPLTPANKQSWQKQVLI